MNIFVLCTGRCGSTTFIAACKHATNFTAGHETRATLTGPQRLAYPSDHIEADNRLAFILGRLEETYGENARYVHLVRKRQATATSYAQRVDRPRSLAKAWHEAFLLRGSEQIVDPLDTCRDLYDTMIANIRVFLRDKDCIEVRLEHCHADFQLFWDWAGLTGDLNTALAEWNIRYNASNAPKQPVKSRPRLQRRRSGRPRLRH